MLVAVSRSLPRPPRIYALTGAMLISMGTRHADSSMPIVSRHWPPYIPPCHGQTMPTHLCAGFEVKLLILTRRAMFDYQLLLPFSEFYLTLPIIQSCAHLILDENAKEASFLAVTSFSAEVSRFIIWRQCTIRSITPMTQLHLSPRCFVIIPLFIDTIITIKDATTSCALPRAPASLAR